MSAENVAGGIGKIAIGIYFPRGFFDKADIVSIGNKANILTVLFLGSCNTALRRDRTDLLFCEVAERKEHAGKLLLRQIAEHIALIFFRVESFFQNIALCGGIVLHAGVMSRGDLVKSERICLAEHAVKFYTSVAEHAGVGCFAAFIGTDKCADHLFEKSVAVIAYRKRDRKLIADALYILLALQTAKRRILRRPKAQCHAANRVAFALQQHRRRRGVHAAAHCNQYTLCHFPSFHSAYAEVIPRYSSRQSPLSVTALASSVPRYRMCHGSYIKPVFSSLSAP